MTDIVEMELLEMRSICMPVLLALTTLPEFSTYTTVDEIENWFKDRMLDAPAETP